MPRHARVFSRSQVYHVMLRGNDRQNIFIDEDDKNKIIDILTDKKMNGAFYIYAFCVMDNHIHLMVKEGSDNISRTIKRVATSYAFYFNKKYKRIGHVFQDRYKSENIEDDIYLLSAIRYIHQNPLKAGLSSIDGYCWSSYGEYISGKAKATDTNDVLQMISEDNNAAIKAFAEFNHETSNYSLIDVADDREVDEKTVEEYIKTYLSDRNIGLEDLKQTDKRQVAQELIRFLLEKTNLSRRSIAHILGLNREFVRKVAVSKEPSP
ncbi:MAG: transposase [Bacillota bacterium]